MDIVAIAPVLPSESKRIHLVAVTSMGMRLYFSANPPSSSDFVGGPTTTHESDRPKVSWCQFIPTTGEVGRRGVGV